MRILTALTSVTPYTVGYKVKEEIMYDNGQQPQQPAVPPQNPQPYQQPTQPQIQPAEPQTISAPNNPQANSQGNPQESLHELAKTLYNSQEVLAQATTVFPFNLFPDTVTLDREKITITHRLFFKAGETISIRVEDILNITMDHGPFFATIKIVSRFFEANKQAHAIRYLHKAEAEKIKHITQGYMIALQKNIDCSTLPTDQLRDTLEQLGQTQDEA